MLKQESRWTPCGILCGIFKLAEIYIRNIIMSKNMNQIPARIPARNMEQIPARIPGRNLVHIPAHYNIPALNNNKKFRSFKSKENIHKKEVGPCRGFGY